MLISYTIHDGRNSVVYCTLCFAYLFVNFAGKQYFIFCFHYREFTFPSYLRKLYITDTDRLEIFQPCLRLYFCINNRVMFQMFACIEQQD